LRPLFETLDLDGVISREKVDFEGGIVVWVVDACHGLMILLDNVDVHVASIVGLNHSVLVHREIAMRIEHVTVVLSNSESAILRRDLEETGMIGRSGGLVKNDTATAVEVEIGREDDLEIVEEGGLDLRFWECGSAGCRRRYVLK
jgi:hypothetical protein